MNKLPAIVVFDLDGTLTESKQSLGPAMAAALRALMQDTTVAIISGGSFQQFTAQVLDFLHAADQYYGNLILLPTTGTQCYAYAPATAAWELSYESSFPAGTKQKINEALQVVIAAPQYGIPSEHTGPYIEDRGTQVTLSALGQHAPVEQKRLWDPDQQKRQKIREMLALQFPDVDIAIGGMTSIDIVPKDHTKGTALLTFLARRGIKAADAVFIGDALYPNGNDYSVIATGIPTVKTSGPDQTLAIIDGMLHAARYTEERPWGNFRQFISGIPATVKIITVNPNEMLSLQSHAKRSEFWHVISGSGTFEIAGISHAVTEDDEYDVPIGAKHRISAGPDGLKLLEIAEGVFDEQDIVRYEDKYGRV
jgi:HAD superfamily hydrolase (TIGR01484 family)